MEVFDDGARALVSDSVVINRSETTAWCDEAEYLDQEEKIELRKEPRVRRGTDQLTGAKIELFLQGSKLLRVHISGNALAVSEIDTLKDGRRINQLSGGEMTLFLANDKLEKVLVENQATSLYHLIEKGKVKGINKVLGDRITLFLADEELKRVKIESTPGTSTGIYYPPEKEQLAAMDQPAFPIPSEVNSPGSKTTSELPDKK